MSIFERIIPRGLLGSGPMGNGEKCREECTCAGKTSCKKDHVHCDWNICDRKAKCTGRCKLDKNHKQAIHECDHEHPF